MSDLPLKHYNLQLPIIVAANASNHRMDAVLLHAFPDGSQKVVCHASRKLSKAKKKYS